MKKFLPFLMCLVLLFGCAHAEAFDLAAEAQTVCTELLSGDYAAVVARFDDTLSAALNEETLAQTMQALHLQYGALTQAGGQQLIHEQRAAVFTLAYENGQLAFRIVFDETGCIAGLLIQPITASASATEKSLPDGAVETAVLLFPGTERELNGSIVRPASADASTPYVIFVHGSGPSDMDQTIGPNKPFRDIAYDLAALGVGSLRFDKITYAHPERPCETVTQEYLEPVTEALCVLMEETQASRVYVIGHSLGGMLTPWLVNECGFDGGVSMAGTPLALWEISYAQNLALLELMPTEQRAAQQAIIEAELIKAGALSTLSDEEAASTTVFGVSAVYQRSIAQLDEMTLAKESGKPFLFLWGDQDVQVNADAFAAWQQELANGSLYTFITYPGLNHLFLTAQEGDNILNVQSAYSRPETVPQRIAQDIASWIQP